MTRSIGETSELPSLRSSISLRSMGGLMSCSPQWDLNPLAWVYFVSFVVVGTFVVINLFIAIIIDKMGDAKLERILDQENPVSREELLQELRATKESLQKLEERIQDK